jgi:hypothetical protein
MKALVVFLFSSSLLAQHITTGLLLQYDMQTLSAGLMGDLSGHGNNGTLVNAPPQTILGTTFDGATQVIKLASPVIGSSLYYTVLYCGSNPDTSYASPGPGTIYSEYGASQPNRVREYNLTVATTSTPLDIAWPYDWHCWWFERNRDTLSWNVMDTPDFRTSANAGLTASSPTYTAVGAQQYGSSSFNVYYLGTLGYLEVYASSDPTGALTQSQLSQEYAWLTTQLSTRGIKLRALSSALYPANIWVRQGHIPIPNPPVDEEEVTPGYTTGSTCQYVGPPCWQITYDNTANTYYSEAPAITGPWTSPVEILSGVIQTNWIMIGSTYHLYGTDTYSTQINHYTGPNLAALTLANSSVIGLGSIVQFDSTHVYNPALNWDGSTLRMIYVGLGNQPGQSGEFVCGAASSTDFFTFTKYGPVSSVSNGEQCANPGSLINLNANWYFWSPGTNNQAGYLYMFRYNTPSSQFTTSEWQTSSPNSWKINGTVPVGTSNPTFYASAPDESAQIADPRIFPNPTGPGTYMFYEGGSTFVNLSIKFAWTPLTVAQLVLTGEGMASDVP